MKKIFSLLLVFSMTATFVLAQDTKPAVKKVNAPVEEAVTANPNGPKMVFESLEVDYGTIEQHSEPLRVFNFTNEGKEPLIIKHAKGSCGCTVPSYPKEPIMPGESAVIEVRYDTKRIGRFTKTVTLTTNEDTDKKVLRIKGEVKPQPKEAEGVPSSSPSIFAPAPKNGGK